MNLPAGSRISVERVGTRKTIVVPYPKGGIIRYFVGAFVSFWLIGWFTGLVAVVGSLISDRPGGGGSVFLGAWLGGWLVGGIGAGFFVYRLFRPGSPERLVIDYPRLHYDSGVPPFSGSTQGVGSQSRTWKGLLGRRTKATFEIEDLMSMRLREADTANRLTIDKGRDRHDIALGASDVEREWLFEELQREYPQTDRP